MYTGRGTYPHTCLGIFHARFVRPEPRMCNGYARVSLSICMGFLMVRRLSIDKHVVALYTGYDAYLLTVPNVCADLVRWF